jgi:hypothetical protein
MMIYLVRSEILISYRDPIPAGRLLPIWRCWKAGSPTDSLREPTGIALSEQKSKEMISAAGVPQDCPYSRRYLQPRRQSLCLPDEPGLKIVTGTRKPQ